MLKHDDGLALRRYEGGAGGDRGKLDRLLEGEFRRAAEKFSAGEPVS
ncbi:hypothetical protein M5E87_28900 [Flavonifractor plautii]|nr:hypothetical protein M5E87_28900 [Flavonifractor plautii]